MTHNLAMDQPRLTIAIPTWNRAAYLAQALHAVQLQRQALPAGSIELLVCDNHSSDDTVAVIEAARALGPEIRHVRHDENLGSDRNIAACFDLARGRFVQIMGDDDQPVPGMLARLLDLLQDERLALVYLRPYGFRQDAVRERPAVSRQQAPVKTTLAPFMARVGAHITFISSLVFNKMLAPDIQAQAFCGTLLVQVDIAMSVARRGEVFAYYEDYCIAAQSNNSGGYDVTETFADTLRRLVARHEAQGLDPVAARSLWVAMLTRFFPQYCLTHRLNGKSPVAPVLERLDAHFSSYGAYQVLVRPTLSLPRPLALIWGLVSAVTGRMLGGDAGRIWAYARHRIVQGLSSPGPR